MISSLYLMPTLQCNCSCDYCYIPEERKQTAKDDVFFSSVTEHFIDQYQTYFVSQSLPQNPQLRFIGGEPYLKFDLLTRTSEKVIRAFPGALVVINTNGTLIDKKSVAQLAPFKERMVHIVSLDGDEEIHNARRHLHHNGNAFKRTLHGIRLLQDAGFKVFINMVLDESSITGFDAFVSFCINDLGMDALSVSLRQNFSDQADLSRGEKFSLLRDVYAIAEKYEFRLGGHHRLLLGNMIPGLKCRAGEKSILVTPFGSLAACQRFVGRVPGLDFERGSIDFSSVKADAVIDRYCYTDDNVWMGEALYALYEASYPHYLAVHELDRILFGVL